MAGVLYVREETPLKIILKKKDVMRPRKIPGLVSITRAAKEAGYKVRPHTGGENNRAGYNLEGMGLPMGVFNVLGEGDCSHTRVLLPKIVMCRPEWLVPSPEFLEGF